MQRELVAIDWGSSRLRAALIGTDGGVIATRASDDGILRVAPGGFAAVFERICGDWLQGTGRLCLMSGMVGSRNGWREAAYAPCPAGLDDLPGHLLWLEAGRVAIVPGLRCEHDGMPDLMRGEEVQVCGATALLGLRDATVVLPGTHSKWCDVRDGRIVGFRTCMTGEFHALLREHSILGRGLPTPAPGSPPDDDAFAAGLQQAQRSASLLASAFSARSRVLMQQLPPAGVSDYLSGLLIGEELRAANTWQAAPTQAQDLQDPQDLPGLSQSTDRRHPHRPPDPAHPALVLVGAPALTERYERALALGGPGAATSIHRVGDEATWHGLSLLARAL